MKQPIHGEITRAEQYVGHLLGPLGYGFLSFFLGTYLNVYYTDVCGLGNLWNGRFMSFYPIAVKAASVLTFLAAGYLVDRTHTRWGKARPWLLVSAVLLPAAALLLFQVPQGQDWVTAAAVLGSNFLYYAVAATVYATANTLMVPLAARDNDRRSRLAVTTNAQVMITGTFISLLFPMVIMPVLGVDQGKWTWMISILCMIGAPLLFLQFLATRERVEEDKNAGKVKLTGQLRACLKSRSWSLLMLYFLLLHVVNSLSNAAIFYYCNWVLGSYQDGITQTSFYALGNFPLGVGIFLCNPICRKLGRRNAICGGLLLAALGFGICVLFPKNMPLVLAGQFIKACGAIPSMYLASLMLGDALDDVQRVSGQRCDGFSSSVYNAIITVTSGLAYSILNGGMAVLGYVAPTQGVIPMQPAAVQGFFVFCQMGLPMLIYPVLALMLWKTLKK